MENKGPGIPKKETEKMWQDIDRSRRRGKILGGLVVMIIGLLFLGRELGVYIPHWIFSWKMLLIAIGVVMAVKHRFSHPSWFILVSVGVIFLIGDFYPEMNIKPFLWPVILIVVGLFMILRPRCKHRKHMHRYRGCCYEKHARGDYHRHEQAEQRDNFETEKSDEDVINSVAFMAGVQKNIISKKFKGGNVTSVFGGTELNLMQADIEDNATLEITQIFGGTKLIVPINWDLRSELVTVMGGVEDKRPMRPPLVGENTKQLLLTGTTFMGGIEINTF